MVRDYVASGKKGWASRSAESKASFVAGGGSPQARLKAASSLRRPLADRFEKKVIRGAIEDDCWGWRGSLDGQGYPQMRVEKKNKPASHVSLELDGRPRPLPASHGLHTCDNPPCCNPKHLYWGTQKQNTADMLDRSRGGNHCKSGYGWATP